jgi:hypothetical protein
MRWKVGAEALTACESGLWEPLFDWETQAAAAPRADESGLGEGEVVHAEIPFWNLPETEIPARNSRTIFSAVIF